MTGAILRGLSGRCPSCGKGSLFRAYLKPVEACAACGEPLGHIRADDGPAWLSILVIGHLLVPIAIGVEYAAVWPMWMPMVLWPLVGLAATLWFLPRAKGAFVAILWATGAPGSETDEAV